MNFKAIKKKLSTLCIRLADRLDPVAIDEYLSSEAERELHTLEVDLMIDMLSGRTRMRE